MVILCASFNESVRIDKTNWNISAMKVIEGTRGTCGRSGRNIPPYERFAYLEEYQSNGRGDHGCEVRCKESTRGPGKMAESEK